MNLTTLRERSFDSLSRRFFYGWTIVGVGMLALFVSGAGQSHTFSVFLGPVSSELGISQTGWAAAYGLATLIAAFGLPYMGRMTDRYGPRWMLLLVTAALGAACFLFGGVFGVLTLGLGFAALRFLGQGSLMLNSANMVSRWFERRRGFALSIMTLGFSLSMAVHPSLAQWLIEQFGWRQAWFFIGLSTWLLLLPVVYLLVRDRPRQVGLKPDGGVMDSGSTTDDNDDIPLQGLTRAEALRTSAFYIICCGQFTLAMLVTTLHLFQVSIFESHGVDSQVAARVFAVSAITMVIMMPVIGQILDRFPTHWVFACGQLVMIMSLVAVTQVAGLTSAVIYAIIFGLNNSFTMTLYGYIWPRYFGLRHLGSIQGIGQMVGVIGASIGALPLGIAFDLTGDYDTTLLVLTLQPAICAGLALFLRVPAAMTATQEAPGVGRDEA
jgi:MFS family permease